MYDVHREFGDYYQDHYVYKSRNDCGQIIVCEVYRIRNNTLNFSFYITTKRKDGYQYDSITGKDGIKSLIWAKKCLLDFLEVFKWKYSRETLVVYPTDGRRRKAYEYALLPLGFKINKDKYKTLYYKNV